MNYRRLWTALTIVIVGSLAVLGYYGWQIYQTAPPIPARIVTTTGTVIYTAQQIRDGQNVWQSFGGQEVGSIWGHGAYVAPDWSADWLHRELVWILDRWATRDFNKEYSELDKPTQASLRERLKEEIRKNTYAPNSRDLVVSETRAAAIAAVGSHYFELFGNNPELAKLRDAYAIPANSVPDAGRRSALNAFYFWAAWACATERPGQAITYTHNWPPESLIENQPTGQIIVWSVISFVLLLAGIGTLAWYFAVQRHREESEAKDEVPATDPLQSLNPTPSMRATLKYFWTVAALIV